MDMTLEIVWDRSDGKLIMEARGDHELNDLMFGLKAHRDGQKNRVVIGPKISVDVIMVLMNARDLFETKGNQ